MVNSSELRRRARETLGGNILSNEWIYALVVSVVIGAIAGVSGALVVVVFVLAGPLTVSMSEYFLRRTRREIEPKNLEVLLNSFKGDLPGNIVTGLLVTVFTMLWSLLFVIPGIVKAYSYSMAFYIKIDHPEYTATQAIDESRNLMRGNKMRLFCLHLSFIGWMIVGCLTFGIGMLWVAPYISAAEAEFYQDLIGSKIVEEPAFESKENQ
jgi:uncharacterized membrane protein